MTAHILPFHLDDFIPLSVFLCENWDVIWASVKGCLTSALRR